VCDSASRNLKDLDIMYLIQISVCLKVLFAILFGSYPPDKKSRDIIASWDTTVVYRHKVICLVYTSLHKLFSFDLL